MFHYQCCRHWKSCLGNAPEVFFSFWVQGKVWHPVKLLFKTKEKTLEKYRKIKPWRGKDSLLWYRCSVINTVILHSLLSWAACIPHPLTDAGIKMLPQLIHVSLYPILAEGFAWPKKKISRNFLLHTEYTKYILSCLFKQAVLFNTL